MRRFAYSLAVLTLVAANSFGQAADQNQGDEKIAQAIVATLRQHQEAGKLKGFDIDLNVEEGRVTLTGNVVSQQQHQLAIDAARFAPGVKLVVNDLTIEGEKAAHPEQQITVTGEANQLLNGLRNAWSQGEQQAAKPTTGEMISQIANPNPLENDKHVAQGYSAFSQVAVNKPVATVNEVRGAPQPETAQPTAQAASETIVATSSETQPRAQLTRWEPRPSELAAKPTIEAVSQQTVQTTAQPVAQPAPQTAVAQAIANNPDRTAQLVSNTEAQPPQVPQPQVQAQSQQPQQYQAVQYIPVPVYPNMYQQRPQQMQPRGPVAYANSGLPGGHAQQAQMQQIRMAQAMQAQALQPQQVAPAPQFIQGTSGGATPARYDHPQMPGYAWPSYASYPNYAALQYPKQYSAHAWPYIGPFYPYPQVPLGWRKVTLSWDDGWWNLDFKDRGYGPYVTR